MNKYFAITIDVEGDNLWTSGKDVTCDNVKALLRFQDLCMNYGYPPTYLLSYEVLQDKNSLGVIKEIQKKQFCEIGAHLHPWLTPPFTEDDKAKKLYPFELNRKLLESKLQCLTEELTIKCDSSPQSYRAGAWGFDRVNADVLIDLGYAVDCSITPYMSWADNGSMSPGKDYRGFDPKPFFIFNDKGQILEIPVSIYIWREGLLKLTPFHHIFYRLDQTGIYNKIIRKMGVRPEWLRPFTTNDLQKFKRVYELSEDKGIDILEMMFHSSELMAGKNNRFNTREAIENLFDTFEAFFRFLNAKGVTGTTLKDYYGILISSGKEVEKIETRNV